MRRTIAITQMQWATDCHASLMNEDSVAFILHQIVLFPETLTEYCFKIEASDPTRTIVFVPPTVIASVECLVYLTPEESDTGVTIFVDIFPFDYNRSLIIQTE